MRHTFLSLLMLLSFSAPAAHAIFFVKSNSIPTPGLPGYHTFTLTAVSTVPELVIHGIDFAGDGTNDPLFGRGF
jgi:hypothetical protein